MKITEKVDNIIDQMIQEQIFEEGKLIEHTVRISTFKDAMFHRGIVQLLGKKGKVSMDRKSVSALVKIIRSGQSKGSGMGRSFTTFDSYNPKGNLTEGTTHTLPNGVKVKIEFKGITLKGRHNPVFLDRSEMMRFFKATHKYMKVKNEGGVGSGRPRAATPATDKDDKRPSKNPFSKESPAHKTWKKKKNEGKLKEEKGGKKPGGKHLIYVLTKELKKAQKCLIQYGYKEGKHYTIQPNPKSKHTMGILLDRKILNKVLEKLMAKKVNIYEGKLTEGKSFHNKKFKSKVEDGYINWEVVGETDKNGRYKVRIHRHYIHKPKTGYANIRQNTSHFVYLTFSNEKDNNGTSYWNNYTVKSIINNYTNKNKIQTTFDVIKDKYGSQAQATSKGKLSKTSRNLVNRGWGMNVEGLNEIAVKRDKEGKMAKFDAKEACQDAQDVFNMIDEYDDLPEWLEAKITKASDYLNSVKDYLTHHHSGNNEIKESWDSPQSYSSKEAKKIIDGAIRNYSKELRKVQYKVVKDWMSKAKSGVIDYFDIVRGLTTGDITKAHPYEADFLQKVLNRDKIVDRFRSYFGGKKGKRSRRK